MTDKIEMDIVGITFGQIQQGAYALLLKQREGNLRMPIVVGAPEAQSIAMCLERVTPPRPLSHDLIVSMMHAFGLSLDEVLIHKFENGVFESRLLLSSDEREVELDSRTSDAIALALRVGAPVFTTPEVLSLTGFEIERDADGNDRVKRPEKVKARSLDELTIDELQRRLQRAIDGEHYELAGRIQLAINRKTGKAAPASNEEITN